jgi:murein DD-endopeptidase MepM/ murein hydrolase activator NlpD
VPWRLVVLVLGLSAAPLSFAEGSAEVSEPQPPVPSHGSYAWPVRGAVLRPFEEPPGPYAAGHRGIDIAASEGTPVLAAQAGVVAFAGKVAGDLHVSIDHPDGVRTSYSFLSSVAMKAGSRVAKGDVIGRTGPGHPGTEVSHLHFGARYAGRYIDPMLLLERESLVGLIHLAPIEGGEAGGGAAPP